jgi:hypothetical protein
MADVRNDRLARLMREAGFDSHKAFARAVMEESRLAGDPLKRCDHTDVSRWLRGMTPRGRKPGFIAAALGRALGRTVTAADVGMASAVDPRSTDLGLTYPDKPDSTENLVTLWHADLDESALATNSRIDPDAWNAASLRWLVDLGSSYSTPASTGPRIGNSDIERFRTTVDMFAQLDNRFGGGHARQALTQYLATDAKRMLRGRFSDETTRQALFSSVAEATLLAAWMAYDSALHGLAQRYFIQALGIAQSGNDRLLAASILDAMSHQATFVGRYRDAANLAKAARTGTQGVATPTLTAHFYTMEARALARLGEARSCDLALSEAVRAFERRNRDDDPEWIRYFDDAELAAEFGHCFRDLGRPVDASQYANQCLGTIDDGVYLRSDFFATMVLADAYLEAGELEQACAVALDALKVGEQLRSARCVNYLREFTSRLDVAGKAVGVADFQEQASEYRLWRIASQPQSVR